MLVQASDDWKFLSKVVDKILLYLYITVCLVGGTAVMMSAPSLYDTRKQIDPGSSLQAQASSDAVSSDSDGGGGCAQCN